MEIAEAGNTHSMYFDNLVNMGLLFFYWAGMMFYIFVLQLKDSIKMKLLKDNYLYFIIILGSLCLSIAYAVKGALGSAWGGFLSRHVFLMGLILYISVKKLGDREND